MQLKLMQSYFKKTFECIAMQHVGENGPQAAPLHYVDEAGLDGIHSHDHLHGVSEGCVQEPADHLSRVGGQGFGGTTQDGGQGNDSHEVARKARCRTPVIKMAVYS